MPENFVRDISFKSLLEPSGAEFRVKSNACIKKLRDPMRSALRGIAEVLEGFGVEAVITSGTEDFKHTAKRSAHYRGDATDWRSKTLDVADKPKALAALKKLLGPDFVVILENKGKPQEHFHIHWSPVYHGSTTERGA